MKTIQTILIGSPLLGDEAAFLRRLCTDLAGLDALIIANFVVGSRQIDFLVITATNAVLIELKNYRHPVFGEMNGAWTVRDAAGIVVPEPRFDLWHQTLEESFALSDAMKNAQRRQQTVPPPNGAYYKFYHAFLCFYPEIYPGSKVTRGDHRVRVRGYADVLDAIKTEVVSGWSISQWETFAKRFLGVSVVTLEAAVNPRVLAGHAHLAGYRARLETTLGAGLAPMLESEGGRRSGLDVIGALQGPQHNLLHGPSGSAKTFHLHHLALTLAAGTREMPFLVEAKRYRGGDFGPWLRQSIAPFFAGDPTILLAALEDTGRAPVLLIDALNECASGLRDDLLRGALAFALRYDARIVLTAQDSTTPLAGVQAEPIALELPRNEQKRRIYAYHAGIESTADLDTLCAGFETAYDLAIAGRCHAAGNPPGSRAELYDRYVAMSLPRANTFTAAALLRHIAGNMHETLSIALTRRTYDEVAERFLTQNDAKIALLDAISETRLIDLTADSFSFEHELLLTYLEAEHLRRTTPDFDTLAEELAKPRNAHLIEFILPRIAAPDERARLIAVVKDPTLLERILFGECGTDAQATLREEIAAYLDAAIVDVPNWTVDLTTVQFDDGKRRIASVEVLGARRWTPVEGRLVPLMGYALGDPELRESALRLFDDSEAKLRDEIRTTAATAGFSFRYAWSETIRFHGGQLGHPNMLPCTEMLHAAKGRLMSWSRHAAPSLAPLRAALIERASVVPPSDFAINLILEDHELIASADRIAANLDLIEAAWHGGIGAHRLPVLHAFPNMRRTLTEGDPAQMTRAMAILDGFTSTNIMLDQLIFETKSLFETVPPPVSVEDALAEMRVCITPDPASDPSLAFIADYEKTSAADVLAGRAYSLLGNIFEDVFQNAYYEAYRSLDDDERLALLSVAMSKQNVGFHTEWIMRELFECDAPKTLPLFEAHLGAVDFTSGFLQDEVAAAMIAIEACARWGSAPPVFCTTTPEYHEAFSVIGEALFFALRADAPPAELEVTRAKWRTLTADDRLAAGAILRALHHARRRYEGAPRDVYADLTRVWPEEIETVLLDCIERRTTYSAAFNRHNFHDDLITHAIGTLGQVGSARSHLAFRALSDDPVVGADAVTALAALQRRGIGIV